MATNIQLQNEINKLAELIEESSVALKQPVSCVRENFERTLSKNAPFIANQFQKTVSKGKPEQVIVGGALLGAAYAGAWIYDAAKNKIAHSNAEKKREAYRQELTVKQALLIDELIKTLEIMAGKVSSVEKDNEMYERRYKMLKAIIDKNKKVLKFD